MRFHIKKVLLLLVVMPLLLMGQEAEEVKQLSTGPETPSFEKNVSVRLQLLDVSVTDESGNYITNLGKDDFVVTVNGERVPVRTLDAYFSGKPQSLEDLATGTIPESASPPRKLILFFDKAFSSFNGFRKAKTAALEFVKRNLSPGDEVMVISFDRTFEIHTEFTRDRDKMAEAIEGMSLSMMGATGRSALFPSENEHNVRVYLQAMKDLSVYLNAWRGRKTFIMFSEGFAQPIALYDLSNYLTDMLEQFSNSNLTVFSIDIAGLGSGRGLSPRLSGLRRDMLSSLAIETGGRFYQGNNNIERMLLSIDDDISNYYVIGISVPDEKDGRYRDVDIEVPGRDVNLRYSPGFYAPKTYDEMSGNERLVHLAEGFNLPTPIREYQAEFHSGVFPRNDGSAVANVVVESPIRSKGDQNFEVRGIVLSPEGKLIDGFHTIIRFTTDKPFFYHEEYLNLEPGENLLKLVIRDNTTGERCYKFIRARMPLLDDNLRSSTVLFVQNEDKYSDIFDSKRAEQDSLREELQLAVSQAANPLSIVSSNIYLTPASSVNPVAEQKAVFKISGVANRKQPDLSAKFNVSDSEGNKTEVPVVSAIVRSVPGTGEAVMIVSLDFSDINPGEYILNATIEDVDQEKLVGQRTRIMVVS